MGIKIYTYVNPYELNKESYWNQYESAAKFAASQTLVNGMKDLYKFSNITTVDRLLRTTYEKWYDVSTKIKQHAAIDNIINTIKSNYFNDEEKENLASAFAFNRDEVFNSIRTMFEIGINYENVKKDVISREQLFLLEVYNQILHSDYSEYFLLDTKLNVDIINKSIQNLLPGLLVDTIVFQGIHQFSPIMLRMIEEISRFKDVVLLFNYQEQFKNIYQTWINIYSLFETKIEIQDRELSLPNSTEEGYISTLLARDIGNLVEGNFSEIKTSNAIEIVEYDNLMEFASYVSSLYSEAAIMCKDKGINPLRLMREHIYAANNQVNSILKMYHPEQFGEKHFLNYPLGQFFVAITKMWNPESNELCITDFSSIRECFSANIIYEREPGLLNTLFQKASPLFEGCTSFDMMIKKLEKIKKNIGKIMNEENLFNKLNRVSYLKLSENDCNVLLNGLKDLNEIAKRFFTDFMYGSTDFKRFYKNIKALLENCLEDFQDLDEDFASIIGRVLERINQVEHISANASFQCLKSTMSIYLQQEGLENASSRWIVRAFEQIDGDILLSKPGKALYHFACLNNEDLIQETKMKFSWPLDERFFVRAQNPSDWKYMVFVTSKSEYINFKKYALFYGLLFNKSKFKLSYIKHSDVDELELYYILDIMNHKITKYQENLVSPWIDFNDLDFEIQDDIEYKSFDYFKYKICHYKFLIESLIEKDSIYKDSFLIKKYMEVLLEGIVRHKLDGKPISLKKISENINEEFSSLKRKYFPFITMTDEIDIKKNIEERLVSAQKRCGAVYRHSEFDELYLNIREIFIKSAKKNNPNLFESVSKEMIKVELNPQEIQKNKYYSKQSVWCNYCPSRELCAKKIEDDE